MRGEPGGPGRLIRVDFATLVSSGFRWWPVLALLLGACHPATQPAGPELALTRLHLPPGFAIEQFAKVPGARSLRVAEAGARIYVGTRNSEVFAILDPERDGRANQVVPVASGLKVPNGLAVARDGTLLIAEQNRIIALGASGRASVIVPPGVLPDQSHHGWRYAALGTDGKLYVAIGAPCNICQVKGFEGTIIRLRPDGHELEIYARGIRNSVGFDWHPVTGELFFTDNGGDNLGDDIPPDELNGAPEPGLHFGFPYVYGDNIPYPQFQGQTLPFASTAPALAFEAHVAALGIHFYTGNLFPAEYRGDALIAEHGSWNRSTPVGYRVMRVRFSPDGRPLGQEVFIDGWLGADGNVFGRPVDLAELPDGSLLISDDHAGPIYRVTYHR
jgi:glucose/arabinose dehydrogenase